MRTLQSLNQTKAERKTSDGCRFEVALPVGLRWLACVSLRPHSTGNCLFIRTAILVITR